MNKTLPSTFAAYIALLWKIMPSGPFGSHFGAHGTNSRLIEFEYYDKQWNKKFTYELDIATVNEHHRTI